MDKPVFPTVEHYVETTPIEGTAEVVLNVDRTIVETIQNLQEMAIEASMSYKAIETRAPHVAAKFQSNQIKINEVILNCLMEIKKSSAGSNGPKLLSANDVLDAIPEDVQKAYMQTLTQK